MRARRSAPWLMAWLVVSASGCGGDDDSGSTGMDASAADSGSGSGGRDAGARLDAGANLDAGPVADGSTSDGATTTDGSLSDGATGGDGAALDASLSDGSLVGDGAVADGAVADAGPSGPTVQRGTADISGWLTRSHCQTVTFPSAFDASLASDLHIVAYAHHLGDPTPGIHEAMTVWASDVTATDFLLCVSEIGSAGVGHDDSVDVDWLAFVTDALPAPVATGRTAITDVPSATAPVCGDVDLSALSFSGTPFIQASAVYGDTGGTGSRAVTLWLESISATQFRYCVDTLSFETRAIENLEIDWFAHESFPPFTAGGRVSTPSWAGFAQCTDIDIGCVNDANCPLNALFVTANHVTGVADHDAVTHWTEGLQANGDLRTCARETSRFDDSHDDQLAYDWLVERVPTVQTGRADITGWGASIHCQAVAFPEPFAGSSASDVRVIISGNHIGDPSPATHEGIALWTESVSTTGFTVCGSEYASVAASSHDDALMVDWFAFVEVTPAPDFDRGSLDIPAFSGATTVTCDDVDITSLGFTSAPTVIASVGYPGRTGGAPAAFWIEELSSTGLRYCVDTLSTTARGASGLRFDWIAFETVPNGFRSGRFDVPAWTVAGTNCVDIDVGCTDASCPHRSVQFTVTHDTNVGDHDAITAWAEGFDASGNLRVCLSETERFDQVHDGLANVHWLLQVP